MRKLNQKNRQEKEVWMEGKNISGKVFFKHKKNNTCSMNLIYL